jgi:hypothetical protein
MRPFVSASTMKPGDITRSDAREGARVATLSWQTAQCRSNAASGALSACEFAAGKAI